MTDQTDDPTLPVRWQLEAERLYAERLEALRVAREWRGIRLAEQTHEAWEARQAAERLFKMAAVYDGLGNGQEAVLHYEDFLKTYAEEDALSAFARSRVQALGGE